MKHFEDIQRALFVAQIADDKQSLYWIEKLLIQLQGYCEIQVRDQAVVLLNMLYDGIDWQLTEAFRPVIRCVGQHFTISAIVKLREADAHNHVYLGLVAPSPIKGNNTSILNWHKVEPRNIEAVDKITKKITVNFGKFWKCGFYDWRLVHVTQDGKLQPLEIIGKLEPAFPSSTGPDDYYDEFEQNSGIGGIA